MGQLNSEGIPLGNYTPVDFSVQVACNHVFSLKLTELAGTLEAHCMQCPFSYPVNDFPLSLFKDRLKSVVRQILSSEDTEAIDVLYCELIIGVKETEILLNEMYSLKELAGYVASRP